MPFLGFYSIEMKASIYKEIWARMSSEYLFMVAKNQNMGTIHRGVAFDQHPFIKRMNLSYA